MVERRSQLGAWGEERTALESTPISGRGNDADTPESVRFTRSIMQLVRRYESQPDAKYDRPAAFVLIPRTVMDSLPTEAHREPLLHTGLRPVTGKIHFVNAAANGKTLEYEGDDAALFDRIESVDAQSLPTLVYSPKQGSSILSWYPEGVSDDGPINVLSIGYAPPTAERISDAISRAYEGELITPDQTEENNKLWENSAKGWAHENAEKRVQHAIRLTLLGAFLQCSVRQEQPGKEGRTDLEIVEDQGRQCDQIVHHAVLELKVLREKGSGGSKYSDGQIAEHIRKGLGQAHEYGERRNFRERMLCCFDMRSVNKGPEIVFKDIKADADMLKVHLYHWFLYRSSEHLRGCSIANKLGTSKNH